MIDDRTDTHPAAPIAERWCMHPECKKWGSFGRDRGRGVSEYWCCEHLPADYWDWPVAGHYRLS